MAFANAFLNSNKEFPSGKTLEDLVEHVLAEMQISLKKIPVVSHEDSDDNDEQESAIVPENEEHPDGWFFPGFFSFCLFGNPKCLTGKMLKCFLEGDDPTDTKGSNSRSTHQKNSEKEK